MLPAESAAAFDSPDQQQQQRATSAAATDRDTKSSMAGSYALQGGQMSPSSLKPQQQQPKKDTFLQNGHSLPLQQQPQRPPLSSPVNGNAPASPNGHSGAGPSYRIDEPASAIPSKTSLSQPNLGNSLSQFRALFLPVGSRAWQKSRKVDAEHAAEDHLPDRQELDAQVRPEEEGLVPLSAIAGRIVHYAWQLFANQAEINSSITPLDRRKRIYDDAHEARKQLIKLLVLVRWSQAAPELRVARNLIAFINDHFVQTDAAVAAIAETRDVLNNARLRDYDLSTAVEILSQGEPQAILPSIRDTILAHKPFSDDEALRLVDELDGVLRLRLASRDILPMLMSSYTIRDGRACFVLPGLFEADLTLSGDRSDDRWWLLRVKFDFRITGQGADRFPRQPRSSLRQHLLALADNELAPRSDAAALSGRGALVEADEAIDSLDFDGGPEARPDNITDRLTRRRDAPLVRLFNLLQSQSLHYRLNILHWQALQLSKLGWSGRLAVSLEGPRGLHLRYWQDSQQRHAAHQWDPTSSGLVRIYVEDRVQATGTSAILSNILEAEERDRGEKVQEQRLTAVWELDTVASDFVGSTHVYVDYKALDAEALLRGITARHANAAICAFEAKLRASSLGVSLEACPPSTSDRGQHVLRIKLHATIEVDLTVEDISGQLRLQEAANSWEYDSGAVPSLAFADLTATVRFRRIQAASRRLNDEPQHIVSILQRLRCQMLLHILEQQCRLAGLGCTTSLPIRQADYAQMGATQASVLFIAIPQCTSFYLALQIGHQGLRVYIICVGTFLDDNITTMRIVGLTRLDWQRALALASRTRLLGKRRRDSDKDNGKKALQVPEDTHTMSEEELRTLHSYSVALICYQKIEQQTRQRGIECFFAPPSTRAWKFSQIQRLEARSSDDEVDCAAAIVPVLCLRSTSVLGNSQSRMMARNITLRLLHWNEPARCRVVFCLKIALQPDAQVASERIEDGFDEVMYDAESRRLLFTIADVNNCLDRVLMLWRRIEKVLGLVKVLALRPKPAEGTAYTLDSFDLMHVRFAYDDDLLARVGWVQQLTATGREGFYTLEFGCPDKRRSRNPHALLRDMLQFELNRVHYLRPSFWPRFIMLLEATLPLAKAIADLPAMSEEDAECPEVQVMSAFWLRLTFLERFALDIRLVRGNRVLLSDGGQSSSRRIVASKSDNQQETADATAILTSPANEKKPDEDEFTIDTLVRDEVWQSTALGSGASSGVAAGVGDGPSIDTPYAALHLQPIPTFGSIAVALAQMDVWKHDGVAAKSMPLAAAQLAFSNAVLVPWEARGVETLVRQAIERVQRALASVDEAREEPSRLI